MKIAVNWDRCEANGMCVRAAPEVFHLDEQDRLHVLAEKPAAELRAKVAKAVRDCPRQALTLIED
jgi:ferredoxin